MIEVRGAAWREGDHRGTLVSADGLELIPGVSRGVWSRRLEAPAPFTRLVASLGPEPWPSGAGCRVTARVRVGDGWSSWRSLGVYGADHGLPRSEPSEGEGGVRVDVDLLRTDAPVRALEVRLELESGDLGGSPRLRRLALAAWDPAAEPARPDDGALAPTLEVEPRSQRGLGGDLADRACSPTSLAMVLAFHGAAQPTPDVAQGVYDRGAGIYGNWSFNVAYAATRGFEATVVRMRGWAPLAGELTAGRPVVISHRYAEGELSDTPLARTDGHLLVVCGLEPDAVWVCDPAADPGAGEPVRRAYRRAELTRSWLERGGVAYTLRPRRTSGAS